MKSLNFKALTPLVVAALIWLIPTPEGLTVEAWRFFAIFTGVVVALILEPIPAAAVGFIGVTLCAALLLVPADAPKPPAPKSETQAQATKAEPKFAAAVAPDAAKPDAAKTDAAKPAVAVAVAPDAAKIDTGKAAPAKSDAAKPAAKPIKPGDVLRWALSGFSNGTVWLIFIAFMFAMGYDKTGLGRRISLFMVKHMGKKTLGLGYAVALSDLALAPFMPSNTARSGGTIFPVIENIPPLYGSTPDKDPRKIGGYLMWTALATTCVTSSMFITALAPNLLALQLAEKTANVTFNWMEWFKTFLPVGLLLVAVTPWLVYKLYPPTLKESGDVVVWAGSELDKMGKISGKELTMLGAAIGALALWIGGGAYFDATTVAMMALCVMLLTRVITWDDVIANKQAWNVLVWFGTLVALAEGLNKVGFLKWFAAKAAAAMSGFSPLALAVGLIIVFYLLHYMFASLTAHATALIPVFLATAAASPGAPIKMLAFFLCSSLGLMGILTPYATGPSPIYYGSGYIKPKEFWILGTVFGLIYLAVLLGLGVPYYLAINP